MPKGIIGKKVGMTQIFNDEGQLVPVTVVQAGPCVVVDKKTPERDGYSAIVVGFDKPKKVNKPRAGIFKKAGVEPKKYLVEIKLDDVEEFEIGQEFKADVFEKGEKVDVIGKSKGKGFQGTVKRWNFRTGPKTHGSHSYRIPGSLGSTDPARVFKGKKLPGRMGGERITTQNLEIVDVDVEENLILVKGAIPGPNKSLVTIREAVKVG